ncbi:hypothetical protein LCGC14_2878300, partial [marine sediment metagenome]
MYVEKPQKPYKNLEDARLRSCTWARGLEKDTSLYPCISCAGRGGVHKSEDLDPIEGYKMAPFYKCEKCDGSKYMPRKNFVIWYKSITDKYMARMKAYKQIQSVVRGALDKLSDQEIEFLRGHLQYD